MVRTKYGLGKVSVFKYLSGLLPGKDPMISTNETVARWESINNNDGNDMQQLLPPFLLRTSCYW